VWDGLHAQTGRGLHAESLGGSILLVLDRVGAYNAHVVATTATGAVSRDVTGHGAHAIATLSSWVELLAVALVLFLARKRLDNLGLLFAAGVAGLLAFARVLSPQYAVWLIPLVPLAGVEASAVLL